MFSAETTPIMFVSLLVAFGWCTIWSLYELTRRQNASQRVSNALHLAMSVVMALMVAHPTWAWLTSLVPTQAWVIFFGLATLWFCWLAFDPSRGGAGGRSHFLSHAAMFAAMVWHLAAMAARAGARHGGGHHHDGGTGPHAPSDPTMWWFALAGLPLMAYLLVSAILGLWRAIGPTVATAGVQTTRANPSHCAPAPTRQWEVRLGALAHVAMTGGMFWMSVGLLTPIIPAARLLMV